MRKGGMSKDTMKQLGLLDDDEPVVPAPAARKAAQQAAPAKVVAHAPTHAATQRNAGLSIMEREIQEQKRIEEELAAAHKKPVVAAVRPPVKANMGPSWAAGPQSKSSAPYQSPSSGGGAGRDSVSPRSATEKESLKASSSRVGLEKVEDSWRNESGRNDVRKDPAPTNRRHTLTENKSKEPPARPARDEQDMLARSDNAVSSKPPREDKDTKYKSTGALAVPKAAQQVSKSSTGTPDLVRKQNSSDVVVYTKIVRVTSDWTPPSESGVHHLPLRQGEIIAVCGEENGFFVGFSLAGKQGVFPCNRASVIRSSVDALNNVVVLGRKTQKNNKTSSGSMRSSVNTRLLEGGNATPRNKVVGEILSTEQSYCDALEAVVASFKTPIEKMTTLEEGMTVKLFQNVDQILQLSRRLLGLFGELVESWSASSSSMAGAFLELGPFFACYEWYAAGFEAAQKSMDQMNNDPEMAQFLKSAKGAGGLTLDALLVMPIQRMPRYKLLLEDLVKQTPESHGDLSALRDAVAMVSTLAREINEKIRSSEKTQTLIDDGANKLARFVSKERTVLLQVSCTVKIDNAKPLVMGKIKADVYVLSDSLLLLLKRTVRAPDFEWLSDFNHIFWPTRLLWAKKAAADTVVVGGPLFGLTLVIKKQCGEFCELLTSEINKHKSSVSTDTLRTGIHAFPEAGFKYDGEWRGGVAGGHMSGKGSIALGLGALYSGAFERDEIRGTGKMRLGSGDLLSGTFVAGLLQGEGTIEYSNGDVFKGNFVAGVRSGTGEYRAGSIVYVGDFANDDAHGEGRLTAGKGVFAGQFERGAFVIGTHTAADGTIYCGSFVCSNLLEGSSCSAKFSDGSSFAGSWRRGMPEGEGRWQYADGSAVAGTFRAGKANGMCEFTGGPKEWLKTYSGGYVDGRPHSKSGEALFADGSRFSGSFKEGVMEKGDWTLADGQTVVSGKFAGTRLAGRGVYKSKDGDTVEGAPDAANRVSVKGRYLPVAMPAARPSFSVNISY